MQEVIKLNFVKLINLKCEKIWMRLVEQMFNIIRYLIRNRRRKHRLLIQNRRGPSLENSLYFERTEGGGEEG